MHMCLEECELIGRQKIGKIMIQYAEKYGRIYSIKCGYFREQYGKRKGITQNEVKTINSVI